MTRPPSSTIEPNPTDSPRQNVIVFKEPGRYGGWPANHGIWAWDHEIVVGFTVAWYQPVESGHAVDRDRPFEKWQARSLDAGMTWSVEKPPGLVHGPGSPDETRPSRPLDFTHPDFAMMFAHDSIHEGPSCFFASTDRCRTWRGPYAFSVDGIDKIAARTDILVVSSRECLMLASAAKADDKEGRPFCARTTDGGRSWQLAGFIGPEPDGYAIMPSTVRLREGALLTTIRHVDPGRPATIDTFRSEDEGAHWEFVGVAAHDNGGNPPSLIQLSDGRLCLAYGYRREPYGIRARISRDDAATWEPEVVLRDDGPTGDLGYPRSVERPDGQVVTAYYFNGPRDDDRAIEATIWEP